MRAETVAPFALGDLGVFDATHLRAVIASVAGAVSPALAGRAFGVIGGDDVGEDEDADRVAHANLARRVARALAPADRAAFERARQRIARASERERARRAIVKALFWELTYWKTPEEYERLTAGEQVHLGALDVARVDGAVALDAGAGCGRVTLPLARRARMVYAMDPAPPMLHLLERKLAAAGLNNVEVMRGAFACVPLPDDSVDVVIACSAFGPREARGGRRGLDELLRVTRPGGRIVIMWPEDPAWFIQQGFTHTILPGRLSNTFASMEDARAVAARFYGAKALRHLDATGQPELPFSVLGVRPPNDLCWLTVKK